MNQNQTVLKHLKARKSLTRMQAFTKYGICELSSRIGELESQGYVIPRRPLKLKSGKIVTEYLSVRRAKK